MKFTFLTYGTEGDTRPMVALAAGLTRRGHRVHLLADVSAARLAHAQGIPFTALAGSMQDAVLPGGALAAIVEDGGDLARVTRACAEIAKKSSTSWMATTHEIAYRCSDAPRGWRRVR